RIKLVFLPVRSPELNLIEVRWSWLQRQTAINNSTFKDEQEIGKAVNKRKDIYNKDHGNRAIINILQEYVPICVHSCYLKILFLYYIDQQKSLAIVLYGVIYI
ncbi:MAG: transposase, partial [Candidatus Nitrosocosmicus sp.]